MNSFTKSTHKGLGLKIYVLIICTLNLPLVIDKNCIKHQTYSIQYRVQSYTIHHHIITKAMKAKDLNQLQKSYKLNINKYKLYILIKNKLYI